MPWLSKAQQRWGHSVGQKALGGQAKVAEWDKATTFKALPEKAPSHDVVKRFQRPMKGK